MKLVFVKTCILLGGILSVCIIGGNSSSAQSLNQQECSKQYLSSADKNLPDAIALKVGENLQAAIWRIFECNVSWDDFEPLSLKMKYLNGEKFGAYTSLGYNSRTQEMGAFVDVLPSGLAGHKMVVVPFDLIDRWTSEGANVMTSDETIGELPGTKDWIPYVDDALAQSPLPDSFVQVVFRPPTMSLIIFNSVPSGADIFVSEDIIGNTKVKLYLKDNKIDAVHFEMVGFKDCDLSSGAEVKRVGGRPVSFKCNLSAVKQ